MFISKRSNGIYYLFHFDELGKRHATSTRATTKSDALKFLQQFRATNIGHRLRIPQISLSQFTARYIDYARAAFSHKYVESIRTSLNSLRRVVGDIPLSKLTMRDIERYLAEISSGRSDRTARVYFVTCSSAMETARRWEYIETNPFRKVQRPRLRELLPTYLTPSEFAAILDAEPDRHLKDLYACAVSTGMRLGELSALDWCDVDFVQCVIRVRNTATFTTKNRRNRTIPMTGQLCLLLAERRTVATTSYVFSFRGRRITKDIASRNFKQCVTKVRLNPAIHFHSLRHTFATWLVQSGVSVYSVQRLLGHSSIAMTEMYSHLAPSDLHDAVDVISIPILSH